MSKAFIDIFMICEYLGVCGGCVENTLEDKIALVAKSIGFESYEVFSSPKDAFRSRCELGIYHKDNGFFYTMRKGREFVCIKNCPNLVFNIQEFLKVLYPILHQQNFTSFIARLFALEVLSTRQNEILVTFIYHKKLEESWLVLATKLKQILEEKLSMQIALVGRSRGIKQVVDRDYVIERLEIANRSYFYRYNEGGFTQPNPSINVKMIEWVLGKIQEDSLDLLEMYCGCGNFTLPLAQKFRKILATETSKTSIQAAKLAASKNKISNIEFIRLSGEECIEALTHQRKFRRLECINLEEYAFKAVLIDPPRSGVGEKICQFLQRFEQIFYISCNPFTLLKDLEILRQTHHIIALAFFDQFPHTQHLESAVLLKSKNY
ncbi:tRNA (uridine(54)-C5)-methyltransferase TrmA [Helicobacter mesocricetorum]|uniref:tRNA (uridine(54)-C5)-methyltransferase TrmA n=1 Tax=Helicobacter mesocricetorum TaxID=87012 RepID=UPI001F29A411|nr:tRNA (uridine(54)-C5)-methyltransferase TrmA [Helicobacter mesocricetorum]